MLGELRVECGDEVVRGAEVGSLKGRILLKVLALNSGRALDAARLAELLWPGGAPDSSEATIASLVSRLRARFGPELIIGNRRGYRVGGLPSVDVDLAAAERLAAEAERRRISLSDLLAEYAEQGLRQAQ